MSAPSSADEFARLAQSRVAQAVLKVFTVVTLSMTAFHAAMVFIVNAPPNLLTRSIYRSPVTLYFGPQLLQSWSVFAPTPPISNVHVWARGVTRTHRVTAWVDVTQYFLNAARANRFTPTRLIAEALAHSAAGIPASANQLGGTGAAIVIRTSAMILHKLFPLESFTSLQIEIRKTYILPPAHHFFDHAKVTAARFAWIPMPSVTDL